MDLGFSSIWGCWDFGRFVEWGRIVIGEGFFGESRRCEVERFCGYII